MSARVLLLIISLFGGSFSLAAEHIGLLKNNGDKYLYTPLFTWDASSWKAAQADEQKTQNGYAFFDGKTLEALKVGAQACKLVHKPSKKVTSKFDWLTKNKRDSILVTTSTPDTADPDIWKPFKGKDARLEKESLDTVTAKLEIFCPKEETNAKKAAPPERPTYSYAKIYSTAEKDRFLVRADKNCKDDDAEDTLYVWLYTDRSNQWKHLEANDLIDIGDFDGNGSSEALFKDTPQIPEDVFVLVSMKDLEVLARKNLFENEDLEPCP